MIKQLIKKKNMTLIFLTAFLSITMMPRSEAAATVGLVYCNPLRIVGEADQSINVTVMAKDFTNLYTWQAGLQWNSTVVNCTALYGGPSLPGNVFDVLAPDVYTSWIPGTINNVAGKLTYSAHSLSGEDGVTGTPGVAYKLMKLTFKFKISGYSDLHLSDVILLPPSYGMPNNILDAFTAWNDYVVTILTNSTGETKTNIYAHTFNTDAKEISFNLTSITRRDYAIATIGFCNLTIPKNLMWVDDLSEWSVLVNGAAPLSLARTENSTHYFIYFTYNHIGTIAKPGTLKIQIKSTYAIPEFPSATILLLFLAFTLTAVLMGKLLRSTRYKGKVIAK